MDSEIWSGRENWHQGCLKGRTGQLRLRCRDFFEIGNCKKETRKPRSWDGGRLCRGGGATKTWGIGKCGQLAWSSAPHLLWLYDCLCDLLHDRKLKTFSVVMVKQMLKYFAIPYGSRNRKTTQVTELLTLLEGCDCHW